MTQQIAPADFESLILQLKDNAATAVLAIREGEETVEIDGVPPTDALELLEGSIDWFYASSDHEFNRGLIGQMNHPECRYAEAMLQAYQHMVAGKLDQAVESYAAAIHANPKKYVPYFRQANLLVESRKVDQAIPAFQSAAKLTEGTPEELPIQIYLANHLINRKRFAEASKVHDRIVELHPQIMNDKAFAKAFAKAKKKSGNA